MHYKGLSLRKVVAGAERELFPLCGRLRAENETPTLDSNPFTEEK
jgi:hypothetical protein